MLICNIGNQHFGSFEKAKELIKIANESGADLIKGTATSFLDCDPEFRTYYEMCSFSFDEYVDLIHYARSIGNDMFFEIIGIFNQALLFHQQWRSVTAFDLCKSGSYKKEIDSETSIAFIGCELFPPKLDKANIVHSFDRITTDPCLDRINVLRRIYNRNIGYADKTVGIEACIKANDIYMSDIIEKHITLEKGILFNGKIITENVYSVLPKDFEKLSLSLITFKEDLVLH